MIIGDILVLLTPIWMILRTYSYGLWYALLLIQDHLDLVVLVFPSARISQC